VSALVHGESRTIPMALASNDGQVMALSSPGLSRYTDVFMGKLIESSYPYSTNQSASWRDIGQSISVSAYGMISKSLSGNGMRLALTYAFKPYGENLYVTLNVWDYRPWESKWFLSMTESYYHSDDDFDETRAHPVILSNDGRKMVVGAASSSGRVDLWYFDDDTHSWKQTNGGIFVDGVGEGVSLPLLSLSSFGTVISLSPDGSILSIADLDDDITGSVHVVKLKW